MPLVGSFIKGKSVLPDLIENLQPKSVLASTTGGDAVFTGLINKLITVDGSIKDAANSLNEKTLLIEPELGKTYALNRY